MQSSTVEHPPSHWSRASQPRRDDVARDLELPEVLPQLPDQVPEDPLRSGGRECRGTGRPDSGPVPDAIGDDDLDPDRQSGDDVVERRVHPATVPVAVNSAARPRGMRSPPITLPAQNRTTRVQ